MALDTNNVLLCIVTGIERSGTTLLANLINSHPKIMSGIECGLLLSNIYDFDTITPFYNWTIRTNGMWGLTKINRKKLLNATSYSEMYYLLKKYSGDVYQNEMKSLFKNADFIIDKTPRYIYYLDKIIKKINVSIIIVYKNISESVATCKKRDADLSHFFNKLYLPMLKQIKKNKKNHPDRILTIKYKSLVTDTGYTMNMIKGFIGLSDNFELSLDNYNEKFKNYICWGHKDDKLRSTVNFKSITYTEPQNYLTNTEKKFLVNFTSKYKSELKFIDSNSL